MLDLSPSAVSVDMEEDSVDMVDVSFLFSFSPPFSFSLSTDSTRFYLFT
jgi:hypothetical protein